MWWSRKDKKKEDDRARVQMELALAGPNPYLEKLEQMKREQSKRDCDHELAKAQLKILSDMVPILAKAGLISNEEYGKYMLDETGTYFPKLIKD